MNVGTARDAAADWVTRQLSADADFVGAYIIGSSVTWPDDAEVPLGSDIDVVVVTTASSAPPKPGKIPHAGSCPRTLPRHPKQRSGKPFVVR
jgi:hypothetical protein